jgi:AcrR family transcriptional regulator
VSDSQEKRRRGRPRRNADPQGPLDQWIAGLSPTALHIVHVARAMLLEKGYDAVTIEAVALEANVDPSTVRRQFASKAGLMHAVFDLMQAEPWDALVARVRDLPAPGERLHAYISGLGSLIEGGQSAVGISEVLARGLRDPVLRAKIAVDYDIAREGTLELVELDAGADDDEARRLQALAGLIVAVIDGLSLQVAADHDGVDRDLSFSMLADMVRLWLLQEAPEAG